MISKEQEDLILKFNKLCLSRKAIAHILEISRATVSRVLRGHRVLYPVTPQERGDTSWAPFAPDIIPETERPVERCPDCGHLVQMPCVYCSAQRYLSKKKGPVPLDPENSTELIDYSFEIQLKGRARQRYEKIRARKEKRYRKEKDQHAVLAPVFDHIFFDLPSFVKKTERHSRPH